MKKTLLHEPDRYGERSSLRVNFCVLEDHERSEIDAGLRYVPNHKQAFEQAVELKSSIPGAPSPVVKTIPRPFLLSN